MKINISGSLVGVVVLGMNLFGCSSAPHFAARDITAVDKALVPCGSAPNCVSSRMTGERAIDAISFKGTEKQFQAEFSKALLQLPRTEIARSEGAYIHAVTRSAVFRFADDLELYFVEKDSAVHVRSASRLGYYDFNVNRNRVETLRQTMNK